MSHNAMMRCPLDSIGFPNSDFLHNHLLRVHTVRCVKLIRCIKCQKLFTELPALIHHRKVCNFDKNKNFKKGEFNFKCLKCHLSCNSLKQLVDHICGESLLEELQLSYEDPTQCNVCKIRFVNQKIRDHHRLFHGFPKGFLTDAHILQLSSISYETMKSIRVTLNNVLQCLICKRQFDDFDSLIFHINIDHEKDLNYSLPININGINSYSNCSMAVVKHKSGRLKIIKQENQMPLASKMDNLKNGVFQCNLCKKLCLSMQFAVNHMLRHRIYFEQIKNTKTDSDQVIITKELSIDIGKYNCTHCDVFFKSKIDLDQHLIRNHPKLEVVDIKTEFFEYDVMDTTIPEYLSDDEDIVMNFVLATNDFEIKEEILEETVLNERSKLTDELNKCLICGSVFYSQQILIDHVKKHRLPEVDLEVKKPEELKINPEKNKCIMRDGKFECSICRSVLPNLLEMKGHMKCHSFRPIDIERMFKCFGCEKEFIKEIQLKSHARAVHGIDSHEGIKCEKCDKVFYIRKKYTAHRRHHMLMENPQLIKKNLQCKFCERCFHTDSKLNLFLIVLFINTGFKFCIF